MYGIFTYIDPRLQPPLAVSRQSYASPMECLGMLHQKLCTVQASPRHGGLRRRRGRTAAPATVLPTGPRSWSSAWHSTVQLGDPLRVLAPYLKQNCAQSIQKLAIYLVGKQPLSKI